MEQELKELLLKDLCSRLPYGIIIKHKDEHGKSIDARLVGYNGDWFNYYIDSLCFHLKIHEFKPYLRPMSSMTKDEYKELREMTITSPNLETAAVLFCEHHYDEEPNWRNDWSQCGLSKVLDYLNAHHFDYRGLIEKGLALEAPNGMYDTKY